MTTKRVLMVLTSHGDLGGVRATGYYIGEAAHPWRVFTDAGYTVDLASVAGGTAPEDGRDENDIDQQMFLADPNIAAQLAATRSLSQVNADEYDVVFLVGGHGTMWDFPNNAELGRIGRIVYESGGVVSGVCHGPAGLVGMTLSDGTPLIAGKTITSFTNEEEAAANLTEVIPFLLADRLERDGAHHVAAAPFTEHVQVDGRLVTGQNPQSARGVARKVVALLESV